MLNENPTLPFTVPHSDLSAVIFGQMFVTEVNSHRDHIIELDKIGTHLKYFSQKQDVVLIKNLLLSVQSRWEKLVQRSVERGRLLDDARKRAKQVLVWAYSVAGLKYACEACFMLCLQLVVKQPYEKSSTITFFMKNCIAFCVSILGHH